MPYNVSLSSYGGFFLKSRPADGSNLEILCHRCGSKGNTLAIYILLAVCSLLKEHEVAGESHSSGSLWNTGGAETRANRSVGILLH